MWEKTTQEAEEIIEKSKAWPYNEASTRKRPSTSCTMGPSSSMVPHTVPHTRLVVPKCLAETDTVDLSGVETTGPKSKPTISLKIISAPGTDPLVATIPLIGLANRHSLNQESLDRLDNFVEMQREHIVDFYFR